MTEQQKSELYYVSNVRYWPTVEAYIGEVVPSGELDRPMEKSTILFQAAEKL